MYYARLVLIGTFYAATRDEYSWVSDDYYSWIEEQVSGLLDSEVQEWLAMIVNDDCYPRIASDFDCNHSIAL